MTAKIRTRFAPSPTGDLHIGSLRTALYAYALAKHEGGEFKLRIEDTDTKREKEGAREKIGEILKLFEMEWDGEVVIQSERAKAGVYKEFAEKLVKDGHAFYCQCKPKNAKEKYSKELRDPCRDLGLKEGAIKLKVPGGEKVLYRDFVLSKEIEWDTSEVADTTLLKSDNFPTYHLAVAVDDEYMGITHVLRGHDWLPSTPIHLLVYKYLDIKRPEIGHLTDILDPAGGKLSKRKGSFSVEDMLNKQGYLPEAIRNFVILLGWAPKDNREIFETLESFVEVFDHNGFQKANPVFNQEKLDWFNGHYIRQKNNGELVKLLKSYLPESADEEIINRIVPLIKDRITKLSDTDSFAKFFFELPKVDKSLLGKNFETHLKTAAEVIEKTDAWTLESLNDYLMQAIKEKNYKTGEFFMDLRIAVTGSKFTPPINDSIIILGKEETLNRLKAVS